MSFSGYWDKSLGLLKENRLPEAISVMENEVQKKPSDALVRLRYALVLHRCGKNVQSALQADTAFYLGIEEEEAVCEAEKMGVSFQDVYSGAGFQFLRENKYDDAARCFEKAASFSSEKPYYLNLAGVSKLHSDSLLEAAAYFRQALQTDSLYEEARSNLSLALFRSGDFLQVTDFLKKYPTLKPAEYYMLGTSMLVSLDSQEIIFNSGEIETYFDYALEDTSPEVKSSTLYNCALLKIFVGDDQEAMKCFAEATAFDSTSFWLYYNYGVTLMESGFYTEAKNIFTRALAIDPYYADAYTNRGICGEKLGDRDNAKLDFIRGMELRKE